MTGVAGVLVSLPDERRGDWRAPRHSQVITSGAWRAAEWESHREIVARKLACWPASADDGPPAV